MGSPESYAAIEIAGIISSQEALDALVEAILSDCPDNASGFCIGKREEALRAIRLAQGGRLELCSFYARGGEFPHIEEACMAWGLWFTRVTSSDDRILAMQVTFDPQAGQLYEALDSGDGHCLLLHDAGKALESGGPEALAAFVREQLEVSRRAQGEGMPGELAVSLA
jgi:hypothetical protein